MTDKTDSKERAGRFTKKPVTIDAWLIDFGNKPLPDWVNEAFRTAAIDWCPAGEGLYINTLEGHMFGTNGSWLIKGVQGELYACKPDIFAATYERASLSVGAGSGPLMGQPQEMPDLSALTERGAKAWAGVDAQGLREGVASAGSEPVAIGLSDPLDALHWGANVAETLLSIGRAIGFGRAQQILGEQWEAAHNCAPRGRMGVIVKDEATCQMCGGKPYPGCNTEFQGEAACRFTHPSSPPEGMAGWKLVPVEPTLDMGWAYLDAAKESEPLRTHSFNHAGYRAMIAAAPPTSSADSRKGE